jgi:HD-GYP domain-containing protein (c-di-GMP phosphodiesterase class II)
VSLYIGKHNAFQFDIFAVNGFSKNFNSYEVSDINFSKNSLPKEINQYNDEINNFAGFTIGKLTLIGVNYNKPVSNYDVATIKALAVNFDFLDTIKTQINELEEAFEYTTNALARAAEANDDNTGKHIKRVNTFAKIIAEGMGLGKDFCKQIFYSAQMHDVGKIYVDKEILRKPGKLTEEEFNAVKKHPIYGEIIIGDSEYLKMAAEIAKNHHEKFDGTGYPEGKEGRNIPLSARIVFIADIYDALRSERPYKRAFTHEESYKIITEGDGRVVPENFDPEILQTFIKINKDFDRIFTELKD